MKEHWIFWGVEDVYRIFFPKKPEPASVSPYRVPAGPTPDPARPVVVPTPWGKIIFSSMLGMSLASCLGVSSQDLNALQDAAKLNLAAYKHSDGGAERALERGAYCAVEGVLRRNGAVVPVGDGGVEDGGIRCTP
jgi:hypothetical protein